jgi:predicted DNA binding protein
VAAQQADLVGDATREVAEPIGGLALAEDDGVAVVAALADLRIQRERPEVGKAGLVGQRFAAASAVDVVDPSVLDELGGTIAYAINAVESKQSLVADRVTELTFRMTAEDGPLFALAAALDCDLELERLSMGNGGEPVEYFTVRGADADAVYDHVSDSTDVAAAQAVAERDDAAVFRFVVSDSSVVATVAEHGCVVQSLSADRDGGRVTAELPQTADVRTVVEAVRNRHPNADLVAQRECERTTETPGEFRADVESRLTDRQLEAVQTAHLSGYFSWPRDTSGEEVAELMGISQSTFLQHLRAAERKLFEAMFDRGAATGRGDRVAESTSFS